MGDSALVKLVPYWPMCVETYKEYPNLGRFVIKDMRKVVGVGIIK